MHGAGQDLGRTSLNLDFIEEDQRAGGLLRVATQFMAARGYCWLLPCGTSGTALAYPAPFCLEQSLLEPVASLRMKGVGAHHALDVGS